MRWQPFAANSAFNAALAQYAVDNQSLASDLKASLQELMTLGVPNANLDGSSLAAAQAYYASVGSSDPFLTNLMKEGVSQTEVQNLINAIEAAQPDISGGSAFADISNAALQLTLSSPFVSSITPSQTGGTLKLTLAVVSR